MELNPLPDLSFLPDIYEYKLKNYDIKEESNFTAAFRIKDVKTIDQTKEWLKEYQQKSKYTWRIARTYKKLTGKYNVYRCDYRCQHKTDPRVRKEMRRISKNTDCPATLSIVIKRFYECENLASPDEETKMYPCVVELRSWHNHSSDNALALRFRDMSEATKEKLLHYFEMGYLASSARHALKAELLHNHPIKDYVNLCADHSILPTVSTIQHLYNNSVRKVGGTNNSSVMDVEEEQLNNAFATDVEQEQYNNYCATDAQELFNCSSSATDINDEESNAKKQLKIYVYDATISPETNLNENKKVGDKKQFKKWHERICESNANIFIPAVQNRMANSKKYALKESSMISALGNFAKPNCAREITLQTTEGSKISVQPTVVKYRKSAHVHKRKLYGGEYAKGKVFNISNVAHIHYFNK